MRSFALALVLCAPVVSACGLNKFDETLTDQASIPGTVGMGQPFALGYSGGFNSLDLSNDKTFQNNGVKPSQDAAIFAKSVHIEGPSPPISHLHALLNSSPTRT